MKRATALLVLTLVVLWSTTAFGQTAITDSKHDLSAGAGGGGLKITGLDQICQPCHVPHNAYPAAYSLDVTDGVLWNHEATDTGFTMYTTLVGNTGNLNGSSKLCLGCHDGVTAIDNYGGATGGLLKITGDANLGQDLGNDHPIGVAYPPFDNETTPARIPDYHDLPGGEVKLISDKVECGSCHDPHGGIVDTPFLREPILASAICLKCHDK